MVSTFHRLNMVIPSISFIALCSVFILSCTPQQQITDNNTELFGLSIEYLVFSSEAEADIAQDYLFKSGYEIEVEQAIYDDELVFLLQVPQIEGITTKEFFDMEYNPGVRIFPVWYHDKVVDFIMYFD